MDNQDFQTVENTNEPLVKSTILAATLSVLLVVFLTIGGELYSPMKDFLKDTLYHHWVGKGVWAVVLFILVTMATYPIFKKGNIVTKTSFVVLNSALVIGSLAMFFFFVYEYVIHH